MSEPISEEKKRRVGIAEAIELTDWTQYAGQASYVKRRGVRRRHRLQAGTALGTTFAVVGVAFAAYGLDRGPVAQQGAAPGSTSQVSTPSVDLTMSAPTPADYPSFPAQLPTKPVLIADPGHVLSSGVIGAGSVSGHPWQISYRVIPSGSAANSEPQVTQVDLSLDGKVVTTGGGEGAQLQGGGYASLLQFFQNSGLVNPMVVAMGTPTPNATSVDLRWKNGTVVQVPIRTVLGSRVASFAWNPANPPQYLEQVNPGGVSKIEITHDGESSWNYGRPPAAIAGTPPAVTTPTGTPNLSQTPKVTPISKGVLGEGTIAGREWQVAYEIIPSGSPENDSNEVFCTDSTVDATTAQNGCTSSKPFGVSDRFGFFYTAGRQQLPFVVTFGHGETGTTSIGLEWADGTKVVNAMQSVEGAPVGAVAFDPNNPPSYLLEYGSYGEYRIPLTLETRYTWTFNWLN